MLTTVLSFVLAMQPNSMVFDTDWTNSRTEADCHLNGEVGCVYTLVELARPLMANVRVCAEEGSPGLEFVRMDGSVTVPTKAIDGGECVLDTARVVRIRSVSQQQIEFRYRVENVFSTENEK